MKITDSDTLKNDLIDWVSTGQTVRAFCRLEGSPSWRTIYDWLSKDDDFASRFARARELGEDAIAQECLDIADTPLVGIETEETDQGMKVKKGDMLGHRKLQIETRLKLLAKWNPKKWGEKVQTELTGANGGPVEITETDRAARVAALIAQAQQRRDSDVTDLI